MGLRAAGLRQAGKSALVGGVLLGLIEGLSHLISNSSMSLMKPIGPDGQPSTIVVSCDGGVVCCCLAACFGCQPMCRVLLMDQITV